MASFAKQPARPPPAPLHRVTTVPPPPPPPDFQSLRVWAKMKRREDEMWHMEYIDRGAARAEGYAGPYELPGTALYNDFCRSLVDRYGY